jgi:bis(5'-nucleosyl)-tetraphosphatase (symmetrical)
MAIYAIGDLQGCYKPLQKLLKKIRFDPDEDQLWFVGDLVNRGPASLKTLRFIRSLGDSAVSVLGNHDLHLLALSCGVAGERRRDTLVPILKAKDHDDLIDWLRHRPLLHYDKRIDAALVHAGILPQWTLRQALGYASEVEHVLRSHDWQGFLKIMYGNQPDRWSNQLRGEDRLRFIVNVFTRMRYLHDHGQLDFQHKGKPGSQPAGMMPWFDAPRAIPMSTRIVCGHWSTLGLLHKRHIAAIDTGCVWGSKLTALQVDKKTAKPIAVRCE